MYCHLPTSSETPITSTDYYAYGIFYVWRGRRNYRSNWWHTSPLHFLPLHSECSISLRECTDYVIRPDRWFYWLLATRLGYPKNHQISCVKKIDQKRVSCFGCMPRMRKQDSNTKTDASKFEHGKMPQMFGRTSSKEQKFQPTYRR